MNEIFKLKISTYTLCKSLRTNELSVVKGNQNHQPTQGWIQNHTKSLSKQIKLQADPTCIYFIKSTHNVKVNYNILFMAPMCLYVLLTMSRHVPNEMYWRISCQIWSRASLSFQSRSSLYAEYAGCIGPPKHQGAPLLSKMF